MKKAVTSKTKLYFLLLLVLSIPLSIIVSTVVARTQTDLKDFIIGRWAGDLELTRNNQNQHVDLVFDFHWREWMVLNSRSNFDPQIEFWNRSNEIYHYEFVEDNIIQLSENRLADQMKVTRDANDLWISGIHTDGQVVRFRRVPTIPWGIISLLLGMVFLEIIKFGLGRLSDNNKAQRLVDGFQSSKHHFRKIIPDVFALVISLVLAGYLSSVLAKGIWYSPKLTQIRLPWDAIITLELAGGTALCGFLLILLPQKARDYLSFPFRAAGYFMGSFLVGSSVWGLLRGGISLGYYALLAWNSIWN